MPKTRVRVARPNPPRATASRAPARALEPRTSAWVTFAPLIVVLALAVAVRAPFLAAARTASWDAAVYVGMARWLASAGQVGLWESLRPPLYPLALAPAAALGLDPFAAGQWLQMALGLASAGLAFRIAHAIAGATAALLAAAFVALAPLAASHEPTAVTESFSVPFVLLAALMALERRWLLAGAAAGLACLAKFPNGVVVPALALAALAFPVTKSDAHRFRRALRVFAGCAIVLVPFLIANQIAYGDALLPFEVGQRVIERARIWRFQEPWTFYAVGLVRQNAWIALAPALWIWRFTRRDDPRMGHGIDLLALMAIAQTVYFTAVEHKETRYLLLFMPVWSILAAALIGGSTARVPLRARGIVTGLVLTVFLLQSWATMQSLLRTGGATRTMDEAAKPHITTGRPLAATSPFAAAFLDARVLPLYYPLTTTEDIRRALLALERGEIDQVYLDSCDLPCNPADTDCQSARLELVRHLEGRFRAVYATEHGTCSVRVYRRGS